MSRSSPLAVLDLSGLDDSPARKAVRRTRPADAGKRAFLRTVGHELRTPLNSIIGFSEIISRELYGPLNEPRYREHAEIVRDSGLRMLKLVDQVMDLVRLESGAMEFDPQPLSAAQALEDAARAVGDEAAERGVRFALGVKAPTVLADARALHTVLVNLLRNAVAYSPEGEEVSLSARLMGRAVVLEVRDRGPGVPASEIARLLRPFEQGGDALTRHGEGAGLGLAITRLLCEAMDGRLRLHSDAGLVATVRLPAG